MFFQAPSENFDRKSKFSEGVCTRVMELFMLMLEYTRDAFHVVRLFLLKFARLNMQMRVIV